jgi:putative ABC transport system permease protein
LCFGATLLILLMVCANVTTLLLARAVARRHEMAVRVSLGGSRTQLLRQLLTETILLGTCAVLPSLALAYALPARIAQALTDFPVLDTFAPDWRVFGFTFAIAFVAGGLAGLFPARETMRFNLSSALMSRTQGGSGMISTRLRNLLIANQLSISLALLIAMGLIARAQGRLLDTQLDYDPNRVLVTNIDLMHANYTGPAAREFYDRLVPGLEALPGVETVALSSPPPFAGIIRKAVTVASSIGPTSLAAFRAVSANYFTVAGLRLVSGRLFTNADMQTSTTPMPIVVSESFARTFLGSDGLGRRIRFGNDEMAQVVGIVRDTSSVRPTQPDEPLAYQPIYAAAVPTVAPVLRFTGDARPLMETIRTRVREIDPRLSARPQTIAAAMTREAAQ